jgi:hypothetical protein
MGINQSPIFFIKIVKIRWKQIKKQWKLFTLIRFLLCIFQKCGAASCAAQGINFDATPAPIVQYNIA